MEYRIDWSVTLLRLWVLQKMLYVSLFLTQIFEWIMYIKFIHFMSTNRPSLMTYILKKKYNISEKYFFAGFLMVMVFVNGFFVIEDNYVALSYTKRDHDYQENAHTMLFIIYATIGVVWVAVALSYSRILYNR